MYSNVFFFYNFTEMIMFTGCNQPDIFGIMLKTFEKSTNMLIIQVHLIN